MKLNLTTPIELSAAIAHAAEAHHKFETEVLNGERDEEWANWYADYIAHRYGGSYHYSINMNADDDAFKFAARMAAEREHAKNEEEEANLVAEYDDSAAWGEIGSADAFAFDVVGPQPPKADAKFPSDGGLAHRQKMAF